MTHDTQFTVRRTGRLVFMIGVLLSVCHKRWMTQYHSSLLSTKSRKTTTLKREMSIFCLSRVLQRNRKLFSLPFKDYPEVCYLQRLVLGLGWTGYICGIFFYHRTILSKHSNLLFIVASQSVSR